MKTTHTHRRARTYTRTKEKKNKLYTTYTRSPLFSVLTTQKLNSKTRETDEFLKLPIICNTSCDKSGKRNYRVTKMRCKWFRDSLFNKYIHSAFADRRVYVRRSIVCIPAHSLINTTFCVAFRKGYVLAAKGSVCTGHSYIAGKCRENKSVLVPFQNICYIPSVTNIVCIYLCFFI